MWIFEEKKWVSEPELMAYINQLKEERDKYKCAVELLRLQIDSDVNDILNNLGVKDEE